MIYFFFYISQFSIYMVSDAFSKNREYSHYLTVYISLLFTGLRPFDYIDTLNYYYVFRNIPTVMNLSISNLSIDLQEFEDGFLLYNSLVKTIYNDATFYFILTNFIMLTLVAYTYKIFTKYYYLGFLFYISSFTFYATQFNIMRQGMVASLFLIAIVMYKKSKVLYILLFLVSISFHSSGYILLIIPIANYIELTKMKLLSFTVLAIFLYKIDWLYEIINLYKYENPILEKVAMRLTQSDELIFSLSVVLPIFIIFIFYIFKDRIDNRYFELLLKIYILGYLIFLGLHENRLIAIRFQTYFSILEPVLLTYLLYIWNNKGVYIGLLIATFLYALKTLFLSASFLMETPYGMSLL